MQVTYTKLRDGNWGIKIVGTSAELAEAARPGALINVRKASGEVKQETVGKVIYSQPTYVLCAILRAASPQYARSSSSSRSGGNGRCRECRGPLVNAGHHRAMGGLCGGCAFDEYDC